MNQIADLIFGDTKTTTIALLSTAAIIGVTIWVKNYLELRNFFKRMNLPGPKPWPLIGNFSTVAKKGIHNYDMEIFKEYGKTVGYFEGTQPVILTNDIKFMKAFLIKDFSSFVNRRVRAEFSKNFQLFV